MLCSCLSPSLPVLVLIVIMIFCDLFVDQTALCSDGDVGVDESQGGAGDG